MARCRVDCARERRRSNLACFHAPPSYRARLPRPLVRAHTGPSGGNRRSTCSDGQGQPGLRDALLGVAELPLSALVTPAAASPPAPIGRELLRLLGMGGPYSPQP